VGAGAAPPPKPTTPTSQRLIPPSKHTGPGSFVSNMGHRSPHLRVLGAHFHHSPLLRPYSPGGAARGSHATGQFSCFGPRSCFIAFVLDIPNGGFGRWLGPLGGPIYVKQCLSLARGGAGASARREPRAAPRPANTRGVFCSPAPCVGCRYRASLACVCGRASAICGLRHKWPTK
jgi:hypothetical protein